MSDEMQRTSTIAQRRWIIELITLLILGAGTLTLLVESLKLRWEARFFPLVILGITVVLIGAQTFVVITRSRRTDGDVGLQAGFDVDLFEPVALRRAGKLLGWIALMMLLIWFIGVTLAVSIGTAAYLRFDGKESWFLSIAMGLVTVAYLGAVLTFGLGLPLLGGFAATL